MNTWKVSEDARLATTLGDLFTHDARILKATLHGFDSLIVKYLGPVYRLAYQQYFASANVFPTAQLPR
jgi:hypothetical protein